ncbi:uncharacterized protein EV422DRAFT_578648 [Fimicolochytrium jonesii]|uniref:uncharacterized protein n=1 Tax=Fimicolochytrium jonesii TaxID=1396493 RepID=UPI0022FF022A|nr:uncharacterized protein EV422DRAFT_578648 [Fimicolochytrium jonesii]KAI8820818.1 hypothetical protein EV422DRAFT_578648 [Fimicolochytrium jonesii]
MPPVLCCPYVPLSVTPVLEGHTLGGLRDARPWRMNLVAYSPRKHRIYVAVDREILRYRIPHLADKASETQPTGKLTNKTGSEVHAIINAIRIGEIGQDEVLVAADDDGYIYVWFTEYPDRPAIIFQYGSYSDATFFPPSTDVMLFCLRHKESAWGLAIHGPSYLLAASSNSHTIMVWNLRASTSQKDRLEDDPLGGVMERELVGHEHNIPSIDFSSCGKFLISCSIDCTVRIWNVHTGHTICSRFFNNQWSWTARFISPDSFKRIPSQTPDWCNPFKRKRTEIEVAVYNRLGINRSQPVPIQCASSDDMPPVDATDDGFDTDVDEVEIFHGDLDGVLEEEEWGGAGEEGEQGSPNTEEEPVTQTTEALNSDGAGEEGQQGLPTSSEDPGTHSMEMPNTTVSERQQHDEILMELLVARDVTEGGTSSDVLHELDDLFDEEVDFDHGHEIRSMGSAYEAADSLENTEAMDEGVREGEEAEEQDDFQSAQEGSDEDHFESAPEESEADEDEDYMNYVDMDHNVDDEDDDDDYHGSDPYQLDDWPNPNLAPASPSFTDDAADMVVAHLNSSLQWDEYDSTDPPDDYNHDFDSDSPIDAGNTIYLPETAITLPFPDSDSDIETLFPDPPLIYRPVRWWRQRRNEPPPPPVPIVTTLDRTGFPTDFVLFTTVENMYLLDSRTLRTCHEQKRLVSRYEICENHPTLNAIDRLSLVEFIDDLGVAVVASQKGSAAVVRFIRSNANNATRYLLVVEDILPQCIPPLRPLLGMFVVKHTEPGLPARHHVNMLYMDGTLCAYEIRSSVVANPLGLEGLRFFESFESFGVVARESDLRWQKHVRMLCGSCLEGPIIQDNGCFVQETQKDLLRAFEFTHYESAPA